MPDAVQTLAATTFAMSSGTPGTYNAAGFAALSWTVVGEVTDLPEFGVSYNLVTHNPIADRQTKKYKGAYNNGTLSVVLARDDDDAGQIVALAALASDNDYSFRITYQDSTIDYFRGKVMSFTSAAGGVDSIVNRNMRIELSNDVVTA